MKRSVLLSIMVIGAAISLVVGATTFAAFSDSETATGNTFTAGTLDLLVGNQNDPSVVPCAIPNVSSSDVVYCAFNVRNVGTIPGQVTVAILADDCDQGTQSEPEDDAESDNGGLSCPEPAGGTSSPITADVTYNVSYDDATPDCSTITGYGANPLTAGGAASANLGELVNGEGNDRVCVRVTFGDLQNDDQGDVLKADIQITLTES